MTLRSAAWDRASRSISNAHSIVVLTGAGISAESGIKTFRDSGGLWDDHAIEDVATPQGFSRNPTLVWNFYNARRKTAQSAKPNPAHLALARLEKEGRLKAVLTQNIDGLHQRAGSQFVVELHGSIWKIRCTGCGTISDKFPVELPVLPYCSTCKGLLRPHVVWFGESLEPKILDDSETSIEECDLFLVIGTSAVVQPAASYPFWAARRGVVVIEINKEKTPISELATVSLLGLAGEILPELLRV